MTDPIATDAEVEALLDKAVEAYRLAACWSIVPANHRDALRAALTATEQENAKLRARVAEAVAEEREACTKVAENSYLPAHMAVNETWGEASNTRAIGIAKAIRARSTLGGPTHD